MLAHDADLEISPDAGPTEISVDVPLVHFDESGGMPLNELTAASIVLWHVSHRIAHVIDALGVPVALAPPAVAKVYPGSIGYSLAGSSLLIGGIGLIILAYTALPLGAAATIAFWGGGISAISGIVESALGWYKTYKETSKIDSEIRLNDANTRKTELEILKMQSEFHPASALVPAAVISAEARQLGFDSAIATHLVNQVLPQYATLSSNYPSPVRVTSIGGRASASAAGA
ncbi:MAG TPA: hypothetical protein VHU83_13100 [Bryobacteraceae bacterium]|nr:hypothetical protein [Bryobacteraceae bacterium]